MNNISEAIVRDYALALNRVRSAKVLGMSEATIQDARDEMARMREAATILWPGLMFDLELAAMHLIKTTK